MIRLRSTIAPTSRSPASRPHQIARARIGSGRTVASPRFPEAEGAGSEDWAALVSGITNHPTGDFTDDSEGPGRPLGDDPTGGRPRRSDPEWSLRDRFYAAG